MKFDDEEINQMEFKSKLGATRVEGNKSHKQLITIETFTKFQKWQIETGAIKFYNDHFQKVQKPGYDGKSGK